MEKSTEINSVNSQAVDSHGVFLCIRSVWGGSGRRCYKTLAAHTGSMARFPPHSQGEFLPSFISAISGWPSVLLPLSEAAEYLSDTSTCQQAPDTSSTDGRDPFLQPAPTSASPLPPKLQGPTLSVADAFTQTSPSAHCCCALPAVSQPGMGRSGTRTAPAGLVWGHLLVPIGGHGQRN